jgi:hypothetical protein
LAWRADAAPRLIMVFGHPMGPRAMPVDDARRAFFEAYLDKQPTN